MPGTQEKDWGHSTRYFIAQFIDTIFIFALDLSRVGISHDRKDNKIASLKGWLA